MHGPHPLQPHPHPLQPAGEPLASQMAFPHHGIPPRSPRAGKWILSSAHCSWNCRHSVSWSAALPSPGLPRVAGSSRDIRVPTSSPTPIGVHTPHPTGRERGQSWGQSSPSRRPACRWWVIVPRWRLSDPVSRRYTLGATSAFLGCVTARLHLLWPSIQ